MSSRERNLAIVLSALIVLGVGGTLGYLFIYQPIQSKAAAAAKLQQEIDDLQEKAKKARADAPRLSATRRRSLPADENLARREYTEVMSRLLRQASVPPGYTIVSKPAPDARTIPVLPGAAKKPAYTKVVTEIEFKRADLWAVHDFLTGYYKLNLLHQITALSIKKDDDATSAGKSRTNPERKDLSVRLTTEAVILDGAEPRRTLLPVPTAFAGLGGWAGYDAVALTPEIGRGLTPLQLTPVLSTRGRDYSLIVLKDLFHGPLPSPPPLRLDKIADVSVDADTTIQPVKVPVVADSGYSGRVALTAKAEGALLPEGAVKIDQTARTLTFVPAAGETGTATVTVVAKAENGQEAKTTFKVSVKEPPEPEAPRKKDDIATAIRLVITTTRSDGTASAVIRDNFNPLAYEIEADAKGARVMKYYFTGAKKQPEVGYKHTPKPYLDISDDTSGTSRMFRVVAIDEVGLVLIDLKVAEAQPGVKAPTPKASGGRVPNPRGGKDRAAEGPADPLAAVLGSAAFVTRPQQPTLFRWVSGKSLATLAEIPKDEARTILRRAAETGPVGATAAADTGRPPGN